MNDASKLLIELLNSYFGKNIISILYILCLVFIIIKSAHKRKSIAFPAIIITICLINPVTYMVLKDKLSGNTYWRMLWMIPMILVIAYAITKLIKDVKQYMLKVILLGFIILIIILGGNNMYINQNNFTKADNAYKLPDEVIKISDIILQDCGENENMCLFPSSLYCYARQYSSKIKLLYGRDIEGYVNKVWNEEKFHVFYELNNSDMNIPYLFFLLDKYNVNYIVLGDEIQLSGEALNVHNYYNFGTVGKYTIYKLSK